MSTFLSPFLSPSSITSISLSLSLSYSPSSASSSFPTTSFSDPHHHHHLGFRCSLPMLSFLGVCRFPAAKGTCSFRRRLGVVCMAPEEQRITRRSPLEFPREWESPRPARRADIFPQFSPMKTPLPIPMPSDPPPDEEEEEEEKEEKEEEEEKTDGEEPQMPGENE